MSIDFKKRVSDLNTKLVEYYEYLHQHPELPFCEYETTKFIIGELEKLENIEIKKVCETGVLGILKGKQAGKTIALRADIDALAVQEEADVDYKSVNKNVMHACGHDGHTAMLLVTAQILNDCVEDIKGEIIFIFQHAEEKHPGGAKQIIESKALDNVDYIFGQHLIPQIPTGIIGLKTGPMFASSDNLDVVIQGRGGHAAMPQASIDPVPIAAETILALQTIVSRKTPNAKQPVISVTVVKTPDNADNVIPDTINFKASIRNYYAEVRDLAEKLIVETCEKVAEVHNATAKVTYTRGYDVLKNDIEAYEISDRATNSFLDKENILYLEDPFGASEDFSFYSKVSKVNYAFIGMGSETKQSTVANHNPKFKVDTDALKYGVMQFLYTVKEILM